MELLHYRIERPCSIHAVLEASATSIALCTASGIGYESLYQVNRVVLEDRKQIQVFILVLKYRSLQRWGKHEAATRETDVASIVRLNAHAASG